MTDLQITLHLMADTPEQLSALTVQAQLNWGMKLHFREFTQNKQGKYVCWYEIPVLIYQERVINGKA